MRPILAALLLVSPLALAAGDADRPLATQGGQTVTLADIDVRAAMIPDDKRAAVFDDPTRIESMVTGLLVNRQLAAEARELGLDKDPKTQRAIQLAVEEALARRRIEILRETPVVDAEGLAREIYLADPSRFDVPETVTVRHILVKPDRIGENEARRLAQEALAKAREPGADFAALVATYSHDPSTSDKGGLLPAFPRGTMVEEFEKAAFALQNPGDIAPLVHSRYGFHVIQFVSREAVRPRRFEEVREELIAQVRADHVKRSVREHVDAIRNRPIEVEPENIAELRTRYGTAPAANPMPADAPAAEGTDVPTP